MAVVCCATAKEKDTLVIPLQILHSESNLISEKTNIIKLNKVVFAPNVSAAFTTALCDSLKKIEDKDASHYVFLLTIGGSIGNPTALTYNCDIFAEPDEIKDCLWGTLSIGQDQFIVVRNEKNKQLIKSLFKKDKGQIKFIREFEYVTEKRQQTTTMLDGYWLDGKFHCHKFLIDDEQQ